EKHTMKRLIVSACLLAFAAVLPAQATKKPPLSPPAQATVTVNGKTITIDYSSPRVRGREGKIYTKDGLISHDAHYPVWRAGANAATTLHTAADLTIGDLNVPAGTYTLFIDISNPDQWVLIVSKATGEWGLSYDSTKDLGRTDMHMGKTRAMVEDLAWRLTSRKPGHARMSIAWENVRASVPVIVQ
ncbi:MAG: DUF2911 domain-containing protein, partial [Terracidiphilus sp.]